MQVVICRHPDFKSGGHYPGPLRRGHLYAVSSPCPCGTAAELISYQHARRGDEIRGAPSLRKAPRCHRSCLSTRKRRLIPARLLDCLWSRQL